MSKKAIMFVDDEPNILSGIKRMLRSMRKEYSFYFAESGKEALGMMEDDPVDVVVSDMRMPGMDGAEFLTEVQSKFPLAIRIMLTGQADEESILRTVNVVHQFLAKPCEPDNLKDVLARAGVLHDIMANSDLKELVSSIGSLPSLPSVYSQLQEALKDPEVTADQVAEIIEKDIAMTAKLLQLVNSSFFGLFQKVESPGRAVKLLGLDTVKILTLGVQIFDELKISSPAVSLDYLWTHSFAVAHCSKAIAAEESDDIELINDSFIAGMLHDIGRLLLLSKMGEGYGTLVNTVVDQELLLVDEESRALNASHGDIGAYLVGLWGFNGDIVEAVAFHNNLAGCPGDSFNAAVAVHAADSLYYQFNPQESIGKTPTLDHGYLERVGCADKIASWSELCENIIRRDEDES